jgi:hypothetical protein
MKLPLKFRILQLIASERGISNLDVATRIAAEYPGESQTKQAVVENHLTAFQTTGIIAGTPTGLAADGTLVLELTLTEYGAGRLRFLPRRFKPQ